MSYLDLISIETKSFRKVLREICNEFGDKIIIKINGKKFTINDRDWLITTFCNRKNLERTFNFSVLLNEDEIFGFHDSPDNLWADKSQLSFVKKLSEKKILKFEYAEYPKPETIMQKFIWFFKPPKPIKRFKG